ncbi:helix-turn-helix transcriptional regulator [Dawidia soli]|uniref:Helix-turn-helix transcriptional regulator n=1 Tax=Dawidia soli TaxID=2782352 RepID=A0AAP2DD23_9BACT|nr:helix-turn-helix transcriptional regulator [Dawidia soli]MBT1689926.1 helix-turn-helix transcriptional regulator [Dawidia soli]
MSFRFETVAPRESLGAVVKNFFVLEFHNDTPATDFLLPDGLPSFFYIEADKAMETFFADDTQSTPLQNGFYVGYCNTAMKFIHTEARIAGASMYPVFFNLIFGKSLMSILNQFQRWNEPAMLMPVSSLIAGDDHYKEIFGIFEDYMEQQLANHPFNSEFLQTYQTLTAPGGYRLKVEELAEQVGYSTRHLHTRFQQYFGMSPKQFIKLVKFNHALKYIYEKDEASSLASIAEVVGYHDQSHFIRDFKAICGKTPKEIASSPGSLANKFRLF